MTPVCHAKTRKETVHIQGAGPPISYLDTTSEFTTL